MTNKANESCERNCEAKVKILNKVNCCFHIVEEGYKIENGGG
jgi:hypothetical protein